MPEALVELREASRVYVRGVERVTAVDRATCTVRRGDRIAIVGPSGSGKSTLLFLMSGFESPTSGSIVWPAFEPNHQRDEIAVIFQHSPMIPTLDVRENVALPGLLRGIPAETAYGRAESALARLHIGALRERLPHELSGGQAQRATTARAIASRTSLVLADEPTSQLDRETASAAIDVLLNSVDPLRTALVVATHDPAIAGRMDRVWWIADGRLTVA